MIADVLQLIRSHHKFVKNNTGDTPEANTPESDNYIVNNQYIVANNRHYERTTAQEGNPDGFATTEAQALQIIGYAHAFLATQEIEYLHEAERYFDAYQAYYYKGRAIPDTPQRWIANWIINGKGPLLANYPLSNTPVPTDLGWKGVTFNFTNGETKIPSGAPYYGEYLDKVTFAYPTNYGPGWDRLDAAAIKIVDGELDWTQPAFEVIGVEWIVAWNGTRIGGYQQIIETGLPASEIGKIKLINPLVNGDYKINFATRNPEASGGTKILRNEPMASYPGHVPVGRGSLNEMTNAADAELWMVDAMWLLHRITGKTKYLNAMNAILFTANEYLDIDRNLAFFRKEKEANTPFTDGISYDFTFPNNTPVNYGRDSDGFIIANVSAAAELSLEQQETFYRISDQSILHLETGATINNKNVKQRAIIVISEDKQGTNSVTYEYPLPPVSDGVISTYDVPLMKLLRATKDSGEKYVTADNFVFIELGSATADNTYDTSIVGTHDDVTATLSLAAGYSQVICGFYNYPANIAFNNITYKAQERTRIVMEDSSNLRFYYLLEPQAHFVTQDLTLAKFRMDAYQVPGVTRIVTPFRFDGDDTTYGTSTVSLTGANATTSKVTDAISFSNDANSTFLRYTAEPNEWSNISIEPRAPWGEWLASTLSIDSIIYRSSDDAYLYFEDSQGDEWGWTLPSSAIWDNLSLSSPQLISNNSGSAGTSPNYSSIAWIGIRPVNAWALSSTMQFDFYAINGPNQEQPTDTDFNQVIFANYNEGLPNTVALYAFNDLPEKFVGADGWTYLFTMRYKADEAYVAKLGWARIDNYRLDALTYTPGVVPFANIYQPGTNQFHSWRGLPYPGYQSPFTHCLGFDALDSTKLDNICDFLYDSQQYYYSEFGQLGPDAYCYLWDRPDNVAYGEANTFQMFQYVEGRSWPGYQPRGFAWAARAWQHLAHTNQTIPPKLITYCENWCDWLNWVMEQSGSMPYLLPIDRGIDPTNPSDIGTLQGDMAGLWLAGLVLCASAGSTKPYLNRLITKTYKHIRAEMVSLPGSSGHPMLGAWSPFADPTGNKGMFYGFWSGEMLRGLGLYVLYLKHGPNVDFYKDFSTIYEGY